MKFLNFVGFLKEINGLGTFRRNLVRFSFYFILFLIVLDDLTLAKIVKAFIAVGIILIFSYILDRMFLK